ncbi:MAG: ATP synthase subunit C [Treponema sp.]|nr:ATP synthase subunit C [Treponema sp.]
MNKKFFVALTALLFCGAACLFAEEAQAAQAAASSGAIKYIAAALAVGIACIGGGSAVGKIGSAAMGAMAENAELSGKALPFVGLAEGICLWGFLVALFIIIM